MIADYLYTVGKYLTPSARAEVLKEIESNLYDYLEEKYGRKQTYSQTEIEAALRSLGHPRQVAEAYSGAPRALIGSAYLDMYWLVVKISIAGTFVGLTVASLVGMDPGQSAIDLFLSLLSNAWNAGITAFGIVTLVFIAIQYVVPSESFDALDQPWSLDSIEKAPKPNQSIKYFDLIFESVFLIFLLAFFNQPLRTIVTNDVVILGLDMGIFAPYLPAINVVFVATLAVNLYLLLKGKWQTITRVISIALDWAGLYIFASIALHPNAWDFSILGNNAESVSRAVSLGLRIGLGFVVFIIALETFRHFRAMLAKE